MIDELVVTNLGIIEHARLEPGPGLTVVSGETGAGKTMLVGALELLGGRPARAGLVGQSDVEGRVEGRIITGDAEVVITRRVAREGRSRAYLNGSMAPLTAVVAATEGLIEVVAQHDHLRATKPAELRRLVDGLLDETGRQLRAEYATLWEQLRAVRALRDELGGDGRALERERSLAEWQAQEIARAGFAPGDDEQLENELRRLRSAADLHLLLGDAHRDLTAAGDGVASALSHLKRAAAIDSTLHEAVDSLEGPLAVLVDLAGDLAARDFEADTDPAVLDQAEQRLALLGDLRRKYGDTLDEVLRFGSDAAKKAGELTALRARAEAADSEEHELTERLVEAGGRLRDARQTAADRLAAVAAGHLIDLGFSHPVVEIVGEPREPHGDGADHYHLRFASDVRLDPGPVGAIASGGELSRLVLALRLAGGVADIPVVVFDEIDAGIGGRTGLALGAKLATLAEYQQVMVVTHLPQVAAFADTHVVVERDGALARARTIESEERVGELARMLAGLDASSDALRHAAELLEIARRPK